MAAGRSQEFLRGVATGAHQTEGNNVASDWWALEHAPDSFVKEPSGDAADTYHRWAQQMDIAASAGFTDYRFGIGWSRIEPEDGAISISPCPGGSASREGGADPTPPGRFLRYVEAIAPVLESGVEHVGTINEPNIVAIIATLSTRGAEALRKGCRPPMSRSPRRWSTLTARPGPPSIRCLRADGGLGNLGAGLPTRARGGSPTRATSSSPRPPATMTGSACRPTPVSASASVPADPSRSLTAPLRQRFPAGRTTPPRSAARCAGSPPTTSTRNASNTPGVRSSHFAPRWTTVSTCAGICTGACWTTTNGATTHRHSGWWPSTDPPSRAHRGRRWPGSVPRRRSGRRGSGVQGSVNEYGSHRP
ncbi:MAG: glycosyl hydrolase family protein [Mycobacterium sp.]|nr:glycosyl hydrolase family protein [Mycobacterium sp.]